MPSNNELKTEIGALAETLGLDLNTEGLTNKQLAELVSDLKAKKRDSETVTMADQAATDADAEAATDADAEAATDADAEAATDADAEAPYRVAEGKALTSLKGILDEGWPVYPEWFSGGMRTIEALKEKGYLVK